MKRIAFLVLAAILSLTSCSKDDDANGNLEVTYKSISGTWYVSQLVREDGSVVAHAGNCSTYRDHIEIFEYGKIMSRVSYADCGGQNDTMGCDDFQIIFDENNKIIICNEIFDNGHITQLTKDKLKIEFEGPKSMGMGMGVAKAIVFSKQ